MAIDKCVEDVVAKVAEARKVPDSEKEKLKEIAEEIDNMVKELKAAGTPEETKQLLNNLKAAMRENAENLKNYKLSFLGDVVKTTGHKTRLDSLRTKAGKFKLKDAMNFVKDLIDGDNSVDTIQRSLNKKASNKLNNELSRRGVKDAALTGEYDVDVYKAMHMIERGETPVYKNKQVREIVESIRVVNDYVHGLTVNAGVKIGYRNGYIIKQGSYDPAKIAGNKPQLVEDLFQSLDIDESFSAAKAAKFKTDEAAYRKYLTDMVEEMTSTGDFTVTGRTVTKNYKNRLKSRKLMFKDGEASWNIENKYGYDGNLMQKLETNLQSTSTFIGNAQVLGVNPAKNFDDIVEYAANGLENPQERDQLISAARSAFLNVVAPPHTPVGMLTKTVNTLRAANVFTKLGSSAFTAGYDVVSASLQYSAKSGKPIIQSFVEAFSVFTKNFVGDVLTSPLAKERLKAIDDVLELGLNVDPLINMGLSSSSKNYLGEAGNRALNVFSSLTGTPRQTMYSKATNAMLHASNFEKMINGKINEYQMENVIKKYGFTPEDMAILKTVKRDSLGSSKVISPASILELKINPEDAQSLMMKYSSYLDDMINKGTPTPTARTRRQTKTGYDQEVGTRELIRAVMQFKETAWKLANSNAEAIGEIHAVGGKGKVAVTSVELAVVGAITYMGIESARSALYGRPSPYERLQDEDYRRVTMDYLNKVAFAPMLSDLIESGYSGRPGATAEFILGPNFAVAKDAGNIAKSALDGDPEKFQENLAKFIKRNMLPSNWIPLKAVEGLAIGHDVVTGRKFR